MPKKVSKKASTSKAGRKPKLTAPATPGDTRKALDDFLRKRPRPKMLAEGESATHPEVLERQRAALKTWIAGAKALLEAHRQATAARQKLAATGGGTGVASDSAEKRAMLGIAEADLTGALSYAKENKWEECRAAAQAVVSWQEEARKADPTFRVSAQAYGLVALATYMIEGNTPSLRSYLEDVIANKVGTGGLRSMLAKYYLMIRDYDGARRVLPMHLWGHPRVIPIRKAMEADAGGAWDRYPCNYYTYRHTLIDNDTIEERRKELMAMPTTGKDAIPAELIAQVIMTLDCHRLWNTANAAFAEQNYVMATNYYVDAKNKIREYFQTYYATADPAKLLHYNQSWAKDGKTYTSNGWIITCLRDRNRAIGLQELYDLDWVRPHRSPIEWDAYHSNLEMLRTIAAWQGKWIEKVETPLVVMLFNFIPLAIAECGLARHRFEDSDETSGLGVSTGALSSIKEALDNHDKHRLMSEFIELPFATMLKARILLMKADFQYKSREVDPSPAKDPNTKQVLYQGLKAAKTYQGVLGTFRDAGYKDYSDNVCAGMDKTATLLDDLSASAVDPTVVDLATRLKDNRLVPPADLIGKRLALQQLGHDPQIPGLTSATDNLLGVGKRRAPYDRLIRFNKGGLLPRESNPLIYALIAEAQARLRQLDADLNWLGYRDDYVPPWRFQYLLERARYFATHAAQVQSLYLNFLSTTEREELQEKTAGQNAVMELANVDVETAKLKQSNLQFAAAQASTQLANVVSNDSQLRFSNYLEFDKNMDGMTDEYMGHLMSLSVANTLQTSIHASFQGLSSGGWIGAIVGGVMGAGIGAWQSYEQYEMQQTTMEMQNEQRELEKKNLKLAITEAAYSAQVAKAQEKAAAAAVEVSAMQRVVALMRHEYALQTLEFLKNRTLTAELWYRLTSGIKGVADAYLKYGIELAFLAEQAFEFEANRRVDVIRFDYDMQETGDYLAGDFLLRDLDSLEQALITGEAQRRQRVRYTVSLARDFPGALQQLRQNGWCLLPLTLLPLEQRFPGLYNLRVSSLELRPVALMDPTRFAVHITNLGVSSIRVRADKTALSDPFNQTDGPSWAAAGDPALDQDWPVKVRVAAPATEVYTGTTRQDDTAGDTFYTSNQLAAFEGTGGATYWKLDMSMRENRVDPSTLADMVLTFQLSGFFSDELKTRQLACLPNRATQTLMLSGRQMFPDGLYALQNNGCMTWSVDERFIPTGFRAGRLRNLALTFLPDMQGPHYGRILARQRFRVNVSGGFTVLDPVPALVFGITRLTANASVQFDRPVTQVLWNFGDDDIWQAADSDHGTNPKYGKTHAYNKAGEYRVVARAVFNGQLYEYDAKVAVSPDVDLAPPLTPAFSISRVVPSPLPPDRVQLKFAVVLPAGVQGTLFVSANGVSAQGNPCTLGLAANREYSIECAVVRDLAVDFSSAQCYNAAGTTLTLSMLRASTNRVFNEQGALQAGTLNPLGQRVFGSGEHSPLDAWQASILPGANLFLKSVDAWGKEKLDLSEVADAVLALEYDAEGEEL